MQLAIPPDRPLRYHAGFPLAFIDGFEDIGFGGMEGPDLDASLIQNAVGVARMQNCDGPTLKVVDRADCQCTGMHDECVRLAA
jgi:hypothetical protein